MASEAIIKVKFEPDVSAIKPALDSLTAGGAIDDGSAAAYKAGNAELTRRNQLLAAEAQMTAALGAPQKAQAATLTQVQQATSQLATTVIAQTAAATNNGNAQVKLTTQLRALRNELVQLDVAGQKNSARYKEVEAQAGKLKDAIGDASDVISRAGSDTRGLDNVVQAANAVAAGFSIAQGAAALFGAQDEDLQKTLVKVYGAMAILNGVQQLGTIITNEANIALVTQTTQRIVNSAQIAIATGLQSTNIVITTAATAAQWLLNAALAANPIGLVVVALAGAIAAVAAYTSSTTKAKQEQLALNSAIGSATEGLKAETDAYDRIEKAQQANLQASNARQSALMANELTFDRLRAQSTANEIANLQKTLAAAKGNYEEQQAAQKRLFELQQSLEDQKVAGTAKTTAMNKQLLTEQQDDAKSTAEAAVEIAKNGSVQELNAKRDLAAQVRKTALDNLNLQSADEKVKATERTKIEADYTDAVQALDIEAADKRKELTLRQLNDQKAAIDNLLILVRAGSAEELKIRKDAINKQAAIDQASVVTRNTSAETVAAERKNIADKQFADLQKLQIEYGNKQNADASNIEMLAAQARVTAFQDGTAGYYAAQRIFLSKQADNNALEVEQSTDSETVKSAKVKLIYTQLTKDLSDLTQQRNEQQLEQEKATVDALNNLALARLQIKADNPLQFGDSQFAAQQAVLTEQIRQSENERILIHQKALNDQKYADTQYQADLINNTTKTIQLQGQQQNAYAARTKQIYTQLAASIESVLAGASDAAFAVEKANIDANLQNQLNALDAEKTAALNTKNLTEGQKATIQKRYDDQAAQLKNTAARKQRSADIEQAEVNGALAAINAIATAPNIVVGFILAAAAEGLAQINVAKIEATPLQQYWTGTDSARSGYALVGEQGPEIVRFDGGEKVWNTTQTGRIRQRWSGTMTRPEDILAGRIPSDHSAEIAAYGKGSDIDYDRLGRAVAKYMPKAPDAPHMEMNADARGFSMYMKSRLRKTKILNQRYSTKP